MSSTVRIPWYPPVFQHPSADSVTSGSPSKNSFASRTSAHVGQESQRNLGWLVIVFAVMPPVYLTQPSPSTPHLDPTRSVLYAPPQSRARLPRGCRPPVHNSQPWQVDPVTREIVRTTRWMLPPSLHPSPACPASGGLMRFHRRFHRPSPRLDHPLHPKVTAYLSGVTLLLGLALSPLSAAPGWLNSLGTGADTTTSLSASQGPVLRPDGGPGGAAWTRLVTTTTMAVAAASPAPTPAPRTRSRVSRVGPRPDPLVVHSTDSSGLPPILLAIRRCESGNNYAAVNSQSTASGAFQFLDGTWDGLDGLRDGNYGGYQRAVHAPPSVQDGAALRLYRHSGTTPWNASRSCWGH